MSTRIVRTIVLVLGCAAGAARAQEPQGAPPRGRDEALRMVDAYVVSNLQESLGLTDEQYARVLPLVTKLQGERRQYFVARGRALREMRRLLRSGGATEAQVLERLERLKALDADGPAGVRKSVEAVDALLTPLQQAKYRVLEAEVEQRLRELMGRAREGRSGARSRRSPPED